MTAQVQVIIDWLAAAGWDDQQELGYPLYPGPEILDEPDQAVFITPTGGAGYVTEEGSVDAWSFQARVRGPSDDPLTPGDVAQQLDRLILTASYPTQADGVAIQAAGRLGSPPIPLPLDPTDRRFEYTCNYVIMTGV
jgi:hypothetical protein